MKPTFVDGLIASSLADKVINLELEKKTIKKYKEELKDKINKIFDNHSCYFSDKFDEFEFNNIKREILELLEE